MSEDMEINQVIDFLVFSILVDKDNIEIFGRISMNAFQSLSEPHIV